MLTAPSIDSVDLWFLFSNDFMLLICLLPFCLCLISSSVQEAMCILPSAFPLTGSRASGRARSTMVNCFARFVFTFCIHSLPFLRRALSLCFPCMLARSSLLLAWPAECSTMLVCGHGSFCCRALPFLRFCRGKIYRHISDEFVKFPRL